MSIIELGALGEFLGSIGVIATLIYLAVQIRQNTHSLDESRRLAMTHAYQARTEQRQHLSDTVIGSDDVSDAVLQVGFDANPDDFAQLTPTQHQRYRYYATKAMLFIDSQHYMYQNGFLDEESYETNFVEGVRLWGPTWKLLEVRIPRTSFREEVDRIHSESDADS